MSVINKDYIKQLNGIRIVAAIWIFFFHVSFVYGFGMHFSRLINWGWCKDIIAKGAYGVEVFFISSGFVISYMYMEKFSKGLSFIDVKNFYLFRLSKIYPLYLTALFFTWILYITDILDNFMLHGFGSTFLNLTLMQSWVLEKLISWNSPAWALSAEWFLYILFPLFALFFSRIRKKWEFFFIFMIMTYIYYIFLHNIPPLNLPFFTPPFIGAGSLSRAAYCFFLGSILFKLHEKKFLENLPWDFIFIIFLGGIIVLLLSDISRESEIVCFNILLSVLVYSLIKSKNIIFFLFGNRLILYLSKLSFAFYLVHYPAIRLIDYLYVKLGISVKAPMLHLLTMTIILLVFSAVLYHLIEVKCQEVIRKLVYMN